MSKQDPRLLRNTPRQMLTPQPVFTASDGTEFSVPLRRLRQYEFVGAEELENDLITKYITGEGQPDNPGYVAPELVGLVADEPVFMTRSTAKVAAVMCRAQTCEAEDKYTAEEWVMWMTDDFLLFQIVEVFKRLPMERPLDPKANSDSASPNTAS